MLAFCSALYAEDAKDTLPDQLVNTMFPLNPSEISALKSKLSARQKSAAVMPAMSNAMGVSRIVVANTKPGFKSSIPNIRLGIGVVTSLVMTDAKGNVWPMTSYVIGDSSDFSVNWDGKSGIMMLQAKKPYANTNMAVMLKGRATPVTLMLQSTQKEWDYEVYVRVDSGSGDNGEFSGNDNAYLLGLLSGIAPEGATLMSLSGNDSQTKVWRYHGNYLILTSGTLVSPSYIHHVEDNTLGTTNVYEIAPTSVILLSSQSQLEKIYVKESGSYV